VPFLQAYGQVLEIAVGTGLNLQVSDLYLKVKLCLSTDSSMVSPRAHVALLSYQLLNACFITVQHYSFGPGRVEALTGVDISNGMLSQASARIERDPRLSGAQITLQQVRTLNVRKAYCCR